MGARSLLFTCLFFFSLTFIIIFLSSCSNNTSKNNSVNNLKAQNTVNWIKDNFTIYENKKLNSYLYSLTTRLEISALKQYKDLERTNWKILVINSKKPNAFSAGLGNIIITKKLIQNSQNEATLAAIIAHEMAHHYLGHQKTSKHNEIQADTLAANILEVAGFRADATLNALNILYRIKEEKVSNSLDERRVNLTQVLKNKIVWGIGQSREHRRVIKSLR